MTVHVAIIGMIPVSKTGTVKLKNDMTLGDRMVYSEEPRVLVDVALPNTAGYPTIKAYLEAEAGGGFKLQHLDQNYVITYDS